MGTRFGRRAADGIFELHDSKESLAAAERRDNSDVRASLFGLIGLLVGGVLTYVAVLKFGMDWPKWLRFGLVIAGGGGLAYVLAKFADLLWEIILSFVLLAIVWGVGSWLWRLM
jgi:Kef-type K+ transport system membrane component KefB